MPAAPAGTISSRCHNRLCVSQHGLLSRSTACGAALGVSSPGVRVSGLCSLHRSRAAVTLQNHSSHGPPTGQQQTRSSNPGRALSVGRGADPVSGSQCTLDPDTSDPTDQLTEQAVEFCQHVGSNATTVSEIVGSKDEAVYRAIEEGIQRVNGRAAARPYHIRKWAVLERDFSISGGELGGSAQASSPGPRCCVGGQSRAGLGAAWPEAAAASGGPWLPFMQQGPAQGTGCAAMCHFEHTTCDFDSGATVP